MFVPDCNQADIDIDPLENFIINDTNLVRIKNFTACENFVLIMPGAKQLNMGDRRCKMHTTETEIVPLKSSYLLLICKSFIIPKTLTSPEHLLQRT